MYILSRLDERFIEETNEKIKKIERELKSLQYESNEAWNHIDDLTYTSAHFANPSPWHLSQDMENTFLSAVQAVTKKEEQLKFTLKELRVSLEMTYKGWYSRAATECRAICDNMQTRLPRELRNMVYRDLLQKPLYKIKEPPPGMVPAERYMESVSAWLSSDPRDEGCWFDEDFVGPEMLREAMETWWEESIFDISALGKEECSRFLSGNIWGCNDRFHIRTVLLHSRYSFGKGSSCYPPYTSSFYNVNVPWDFEKFGLLESLIAARIGVRGVRVIYLTTPVLHETFKELGQGNMATFWEATFGLLATLAALWERAAGVTWIQFLGESACDHLAIEIGKRHRAMTRVEWAQEFEDSPRDVLSPEEAARYFSYTFERQRVPRSVARVYESTYRDRVKSCPLVRSPWGWIKAFCEKLGGRWYK
ncbi:hypothetical protein BU23DRAFT_2819 [Bimuria novae-zelandiae CBS 107.79]|uniref:Uncharacterized protein n=1 Tax=Bimuria novae-zelandiae CBS 107.79 TaxID=1447943 RepID=A0A6A5VWJ6_9PLEO|nr:hypothetical protein BU23DRAFT_2819 [Bimuria novae-zelandiae CBS 107.79]